MTRHDSIPTLTLQETADELDVHYMTAYRYVRLGMLPATRKGRSWVIRRDDLDAFASDDSPRPQRGDAPWDQRLVNRMIAKDEAGAWSVIEAAMASGVAPKDVYTTMIVPALRSIGEQWEQGSIGIADEHAASHIAGRVMARLGSRMVSRGVRRGTVVLGSTATERHDLPISILADLLRVARFEVVNLGANLPADSFADAIASNDDVVAAAIGVTTSGQDDEIAATVSAIRNVTDVPLVIGGAGIAPERAIALGASATATTGEEAVAAIEALAAGS